MAALLAEEAGAAVAPEAVLPLYAAQTVAKSGKSIFGGLIIGFAVLLVIISIIIVSAATTSGGKMAGWMLFGLSLVLGGFGGYLMARKSKDE